MKNTFIRLGILGLFSLLCGAFSTARTTYEGEDNHPDSNNLVVSNRVILEDKVGHDTICPVKFDSIVVQRCASDTTFKIDGKVVGYGIHYIVFKLPNGCDSTLKIYFIKGDPYVGLFSNPIQPDIGFGTGRIQVDAGIGTYSNIRTYTYKWSNGSQGTTLSNLKAGQYTVTATDNIGCSSVWDFTVPLVKAYDIPNAFTPNNDGLNDSFAPIFHLKPNFMVFKIFNRLGNLVYNNETPDTGWDGNIKGQEAASDVYVYWLELDYGDGHILRGSGEVSLIR